MKEIVDGHVSRVLTVPRAKLLLGFAYQSGYGVAKDDEEAERWFREAAEEGDWFAADELQKYERDHDNAEDYDQDRLEDPDPDPFQ